MGELEGGKGQTYAGWGIVLLGLLVGSVGLATAGIGIGIPLIPVGLYLVARGIYSKQSTVDAAPKPIFERTGAGRFWLGVLLCIIGVPALATGVGIPVVAVGAWLIWRSVTSDGAGER